MGDKRSIKIILKVKEGVELFTVPWQGRPSMVSDDLVTEIKAILDNLCVNGQGHIQRIFEGSVF